MCDQFVLELKSSIGKNKKKKTINGVRVYWLDQVPDILSNERLIIRIIKNQRAKMKKKKKTTEN